MAYLRRYTLAAVVVLVVLILLLVRPAKRRYENMLSGLWVGDPGFLKKSNLSDMQLFVAPADGGVRQGYLIMTDATGRFITNGPLELRCRFGPKLFASMKSSLSPTDDAVTGRVELRYDAEDALEHPLPLKMRISLSLSDCSMTLFDDDKVFAYLYRDAAASHAALLALKT